MADSVELPTISESWNGSDSLAVPPLRIHHAFAATAVAAVVLSFERVLQRNNSFQMGSFVDSAIGVWQAIVMSLAVTVIGFGFYWRRHGIPFFRQPGHWLLLVQAAGLWVVAVAVYVLLAQFAGGQATFGPVFFTILSVFNVAILLIDIWAAIRVADTGWWRLVFATSACRLVVSLLIPKFVAPSESLFLALQWGLALPVYSMLALAATTDWLAGRRRDWPHWLGVWICFASGAVWVVAQLVAAFAWVWMPK